jgi:uncharacterized membrane protein (DUF485 family)
MKIWLWLGIVMLVAWAALWLGLKIVSGAIHLLLLFAVVAFVWAAVARVRAHHNRYRIER